MAKALKKDGSDAIVYVSSGEGATSEGEFFEAVNWATREELPVLFVIQNNGLRDQRAPECANDVRGPQDRRGLRPAELSRRWDVV